MAMRTYIKQKYTDRLFTASGQPSPTELVASGVQPVQQSANIVHSARRRPAQQRQPTLPIGKSASWATASISAANPFENTSGSVARGSQIGTSIAQPWSESAAPTAWPTQSSWPVAGNSTLGSFAP